MSVSFSRHGRVGFPRGPQPAASEVTQKAGEDCLGAVRVARSLCLGGRPRPTHICPAAAGTGVLPDA